MLTVMVPKSPVRVPAVPVKVGSLLFVGLAMLFKVTTGRIVPTCTAAPLLVPLTVTVAAKLPAPVAGVVTVTVSWVAVAVATLPTTPWLKVTVSLAAVVEKPAPLIVMVVLPVTFVVLAVTTGATVATCTALPLLTLSTVTLAFRAVPPVTLLSPVRLTVRLVPVAAVTVPVTPLSKVTLSLAVVVSKPKPVIVKLVALAARLALLAVTTGATVATCTALPLLTPSTVTLAFRAVPPVTLLSPVRLTVRLVLVAAVTVPVTPLLESHAVVGRGGVEAEAGNGQAGGVGGQIGAAGGDHRGDRGDLHGAAAADAVHGDAGMQAVPAVTTAQPGEAHGQAGAGGGGHGAGHAVVEGHAVVGRGGVEAEAGNRHTGGVGGQIGAAGGDRPGQPWRPARRCRC